MVRAGLGSICVVLVAVAMAGCSEKAAETPERAAAERGPSGEKASQPQGLRVPAGFKAKEGTTPEPYTNTGLPKEIIHERTGIEMIFIPAGEFMMGSPARELDRSADEGPVHRVRIAKPFYLGRYEVTQGEWREVKGNNPSHFKGSHRLPVESVPLNDVRDFCQRAGNGLRLPTEAQWEYACRAGSQTRFSFKEDEDLGDYAWYEQNSDYKTHEVGLKRANAFGLHDMHGNVSEWCSEWYHKDYYAVSPANDPPGPNDGRFRLLRGGSWGDFSSDCRSAVRWYVTPRLSNIHAGFRVAVDVP